RELLARRTDLGTFVVHLSREYKSGTAQENLKGIIELKLIRARSPFGAACDALRKRSAPKEDVESQRCVSFTETPLEHLHLLLQEVEDMKRDCRFGPYGIAVTSLPLGRQGYFTSTV
ncbi:MAG TPA: hypothetical protein VFU40_04550, partial [Gemmatimonadales bacterium]|nr:hypothetical protein [Gemmatimonadales bacterium]